MIGVPLPRPGQAARPRRSPLVAQLAEPDEHGLGVGVVGEIGERLAQARDHARAVEPEEGVDLLLERERRDQRRVGVLVMHLGKQRPRRRRG